MSESHTSTQEWQVFEGRMRRRRADQCLLRASAALDAEFPEIAEQVLDEARALCPSHPEVEEIAARIQSVSSSSGADPARGMLLRALLAIVSLLTAVAMLY